VLVYIELKELAVCAVCVVVRVGRHRVGSIVLLAGVRISRLLRFWNLAYNPHRPPWRCREAP
jgi:hypothetical protein